MTLLSSSVYCAASLQGGDTERRRSNFSLASSMCSLQQLSNEETAHIDYANRVENRIASVSGCDVHQHLTFGKKISPCVHIKEVAERIRSPVGNEAVEGLI